MSKQAQIASLMGTASAHHEATKGGNPVNFYKFPESVGVDTGRIFLGLACKSTGEGTKESPYGKSVLSTFAFGVYKLVNAKSIVIAKGDFEEVKLSSKNGYQPKMGNMTHDIELVNAKLGKLLAELNREAAATKPAAAASDNAGGKAKADTVEAIAAKVERLASQLGISNAEAAKLIAG